MKKKGRLRWIGGIRFRSDGNHHWWSECKRFVIFHVMRNTTFEQWELYRRGKKDDMEFMLDAQLSLKELSYTRTIEPYLRKGV